MSAPDGNAASVPKPALPPERCVEQRESFDCMTACLATIFGCRYEAAPFLADKYTGDPVDQWLAVMTRWLHERGFHPQSFSLTKPMMKHYTPERSPWYWPTLWMGGVKSPRYDGEHAVVCRGADIVWDPHPQREMGHLGFTSAEIFLPVDPARLALGDDPMTIRAALREFGGGDA